MGGDAATLDHPGEGIVEGDESTADAGRSGAPVGLQDVTVDHHLALAQHGHVAGRSQRPTDQALNLDGSAVLLALGGFAPDSRATSRATSSTRR